MKDADGEKVLLQRGEVIKGEDGKIKVSGRELTLPDTHFYNIRLKFILIFTQ